MVDIWHFFSGRSHLLNNILLYLENLLPDEPCNLKINPENSVSQSPLQITQTHVTWAPLHSLMRFWIICEQLEGGGPIRKTFGRWGLWKHHLALAGCHKVESQSRMSISGENRGRMCFRAVLLYGYNCCSWKLIPTSYTIPRVSCLLPGN